MTDFPEPAPAPGAALVPIEVWQVPAAPRGETMSLRLAQRLIVNFTRRRNLVLDLTGGEQLARVARTSRRRHARHTAATLGAPYLSAALIVAAAPGDPAIFFADCATRLLAGGHAVVVLDGIDFTVNPRLIAAARTAGLAYVQHLVGAAERELHTDVLVFALPADRPCQFR
ncbi:hypothetical protein [Actinoplanes sp. DH11]|uniref:hypothetical protein n=1 Tax=Actinoplanes sp. DH11 TaxID=2857011 RepID=UPI001E5EE1F8|nr:hypothetical protein [Actinoplanes sp. DH11]